MTGIRRPQGVGRGTFFKQLQVYFSNSRLDRRSRLSSLRCTRQRITSARERLRLQHCRSGLDRRVVPFRNRALRQDRALLEPRPARLPRREGSRGNAAADRRDLRERGHPNRTAGGVRHRPVDAEAGHEQVSRHLLVWRLECGEFEPPAGIGDKRIRGRVVFGAVCREDEPQPARGLQSARHAPLPPMNRATGSAPIGFLPSAFFNRRPTRYPNRTHSAKMFLGAPSDAGDIAFGGFLVELGASLRGLPRNRPAHAPATACKI